MQNYGEYFGCYAVYKDRQIVEFIDVFKPIKNAVGLGDKFPTYVKCGNCNCWMEHKVRSFKCPKCGCLVTDSKVMEAMTEDNLRNEQKMMDEYDTYW